MSDTHVQESPEPQARRSGPRVWSSILLIVSLTVALDQLTKRIVSMWLGREAVSHRWEIAGPYIAVEYLENTGAAFGILAGRVWLLTGLATGVALTFFLAFRSAIGHDRTLRNGLGLIVGGAAGNVLDRIRFGHVIDFIAIGVWPKFNVADSAITVGIILLAISLLREAETPNDPPDPADRTARCS